MIGQLDVDADFSNAESVNRLFPVLPQNALHLCSDLARARQTAAALNLNPQFDPRLREISYGEWEGLAFDAAPDPDLARAFWESPGDIAPPGGESWNDLSARVSALIDEVNGAGDGPVIAVGHMGSILAALSYATGLPPERALSFRIDPLSITRLDYLDGPWAISCVNA